MSNLSPPRIVCAALIASDGLIIPGARHYSPEMRELLKRIYGSVRQFAPDQQGFVDQHGRYYDREVAWRIAERSGQIIKRVGGDAHNGGTLYSENLY